MFKKKVILKNIFIFFISILPIFYFKICFSNETIPTYHWAYSYIDHLRVRGYFSNLSILTKPYTRNEIAKQLLAINKQKNNSKIYFRETDSWLLNRLFKEFEFEMTNISKKGNPKFKIGLWTKGSSKFSENDESLQYYLKSQTCVLINEKIAFFNSIKFDKYLADDPEYFGRVWNNHTAFTEQAYIRYSSPSYSLTFGRDFLTWGSGKTGKLLLSDNSRPLDQISFSTKYKFLKFSFIGARLDSWALSNLELQQRYFTTTMKRYFSAHRLDFAFKNRYYFGFSEALLYGGASDGLELQYLNPFLYYHGELLNQSGSDGNGFLSFDFDFFPFENFEFYGEIMIDDIQIEDADTVDLEPTEYGVILGFQNTNLFGIDGAAFRIEYVRIANRTYNSSFEWEKYLHRNRSIGYYLGNDFDLWSLQFSKWFLEDFYISGEFNYLCQGEGSIKKEWDTPWMNYNIKDIYSEPFPSGIVEKKISYEFSLKYQPKDKYYIHAEFQYNNITNWNNVSGIDHNYWAFNLGFWYNINVTF